VRRAMRQLRSLPKKKKRERKALKRRQKTLMPVKTRK